MPSLDRLHDRHVVIDKRPGQYCAFPDVCLTAEGGLLCVYREADRHVASRSMLLLRESRDFGRSWGDIRILDGRQGHCPRISRLSGDAIAVIEDMNRSLYISYDHGRTFAARPLSGPSLPIPDRLLELDPETWLTTAHTHRGTHPEPKTGQARTEQMVCQCSHRGAAFGHLSVMACDPCLALCEASMTRLPDGRILSLLRENSMVYEPMYACLSEDDGKTWSLPMPTPLIGHRPCLGVTSSGKLLVTYRAIGPDGGVAAWMGDVDGLLSDFAVHGRTPSPDNPRLTGEGLVIENAAGPDACARYCLRPMTDPEYAEARTTFEVRADAALSDGCGVRFGLWWRIFPDRIEPEGLPPIPLPILGEGQFHSLGFRYKNGRVALTVGGKRQAVVAVDPKSAATRPFVFGTVSPASQNGGRHVWKSITHRVIEPRYGRDRRFAWDFTMGLPDAWAKANTLEIANDRFAAAMDYGYSGWIELPDGRFFCAYHFGGGLEEGYEPGLSSHIRGTWIEPGDFSGS